MICLTVSLKGQSVTVNAVGDLLHVRAPDFRFIKGAALDRLKDGRSVRFDFELAVRVGSQTATTIETRQSFLLSYDLWEERFAVTQAGTPARSVSHLTLADAEAWCIDAVRVPVSALNRVGGSAAFWITLSYNVPDDVAAPASSDDAGFTLRGLIDRLSRRRSGELHDAIQAGPFQLK